MQVALGLDLEVDRAVAGDLVEHVVEEGTPVLNRPTPVPSRLIFTETWPPACYGKFRPPHD